MAASSSDRNLLLGILGLQRHFIDRDQLIAAMDAWLLKKSGSIGDLLVDMRYLEPEEHERLKAVVNEYIVTHENAPQETPPFVGTTFQELEQATDVRLRETLARSSQDQEDHGIDTTATSDGVFTSQGTRFRVLRPHAQGGVGIVTVALDEGFDREVALKELNSHHAADPDTRARFLLEARLTGILEHPGIVPVYGLGQDAEGRLFYAMRLVHGDTLKDAIETLHKADKAGVGTRWESFEFRKIIGRFVEVCHTIHYAHSRGIVHRDLKPSNIILGQYGETLVLDWGLAKPVSASERPFDSTLNTVCPPSAEGPVETRTGEVVGTPGYMSPEQAGGEQAEVGPSSDIYSLGATLYCLLTGRPAFEGKLLEEVLQKVKRGDFLRPRQMNRRLDRGLEAICLKAMAMDPGERYVSAGALADDVERWLADKPVSVYRESSNERIARWARDRGESVPAFLCLLGAIVTCAFLFIGYTVYRSYRSTSQAFLEVVSQKAAVGLEFDLAIQEYVDRTMGREMANRIDKDGFVVETKCSSVIARDVFQHVRRRLPEYTIKFSSDDPRNLENKAGPAESKMLQYFTENPEVSDWNGRFDMDGMAYFACVGVRRTEQGCLRCHGSPGDSPKSLLDRYGETGGFHRKVGDVAGMVVVAVPMDRADAAFFTDVASDLGGTALLLMLLFATILVALGVVVRRSPLRHVSFGPHV